LTSRAVSSSAIARASGSEPGEAVELGHDEFIAGAAGRERFTQAGSGAAGPGEAVVDVDPLGLDAERLERVALGGQVLGVRGDAGVADLESGHARKCVPYTGRSPAQITEPVLRHTAGPVPAERLLGVVGVPVRVPIVLVATIR
jgi:hypothetical protein